jgi:hypothetical protein
MMYLTAIFLSPLYFAINGKWGAFLINCIFYGTAVVLLLTFIGAFLAPFPWFIAAVHAIMDYRKQLVEEAATIMATKMAAAMRQQPPPAP